MSMLKISIKSSLFHLLYVVFLKDLFSNLFISYTPFLSVLSYLIHLQIIICMQMILNFSYNSLLLTLHTITIFLNLLCLMSTINWMSSNFLSLNPSKTEFLLVGLPQQLSKLSNPMIHLSNNVTLSAVHSTRNLRVIFDNNLTFSEHISTVSKSCFYHIRDLRRIRNSLL
jgi:hypothetical protein